MGWIQDQVSSFQSSMGWDMDEKRRKAFEAETNKVMGEEWAAKNPDAFKTMLANEQSRSLEKRQKLFDVAAEGGAAHGGTAVAGGGTTGVSYADPYPGDPSDRFPKAPTEEEEKYRLALRGPVPGMMTYRGWT